MRALATAALLGSLVSPALAGNVDDMLTEMANRYDIDPRIVHAVAMIESDKRCGLHDGPHRGIMQVAPATAREVGVWPLRSCQDEIEAGVRYLKKAIDKGGSGCAGISLYNIGLNNRPTCTGYGRRVLNRLRSL